MKCCSENVTGNYVPPPIGNGDLSIQIDNEGIQRQKSYYNMTPCIYRAGRRYDSTGYPLVPFGYFLQDSGTINHWTQELDVINARILTECNYADGSTIETETFVHLNHPLLAIRKRFSGKYTFRYLLADIGEDRKPPKRMRFITDPHEHGIDIHYELDDMQESRGVISIWTNCKNAEISVNKNEFIITVESKSGADFFITMNDSIDNDDINTSAMHLRDQVKTEGYDGMFASHQTAWAEYWAESYVKLPSQKEQDLYYTAQYHLRISSTRWSLPVGIFPGHWQGKYFSFDDYFSFMGLVTSGHHAMARRIPEFRFKTMPQAKDRAHRYFGQNLSGARWYWELLEDGNTEGSVGGFWLEHIFHIANIALGAWYYYQYSGDREYLENIAWPVINACAEFYQVQSIQPFPDGRLIVGKCTDLERLGPGRENAFMTTCGVIATLESAAKAAELLGLDPAKVTDRRNAAGKLRESLPKSEGRYIPYPECPEKSIALFAGLFPYPALAKDDPCQLAAINDYLACEKDYGNMYPVGNSVCTWYAGWKGVAFARMGNFATARECIEQCVDEAKNNCFSEIFEIGNPPHHPWFTTAEGSYVHLVNETLLQSTENEIRIPDNGMKDYAFKLAAVGGVMVEAEVSAGQTRRLQITATVPYSGKLILPDNKVIQLELQAGQNKKVF